jgi:DNA-binding response OmpR family regulator
MSNTLDAAVHRILLVDQNSSWIQWATHVLCEDGYDVRALFSLDEAIDLLKHEHFDLVVLGSDIAKKRLDIVRRFSKRSRRPIRFMILAPIRIPYPVLRLLWKAGASEIRSKTYDRLELLAMIASELRTAENIPDFSKGDRLVYARSIT